MGTTVLAIFGCQTTATRMLTSVFVLFPINKSLSRITLYRRTLI
jgi:hypothetical protein